MKQKLLSILTLSALIFLISCETDESGFINTPLPYIDDITSDTTLVGDQIHNIVGYVYVREGATLTIEPGAILKFAEGLETAASALIVTRGAKIMAEGTPDKPIIMTSTLDNIEVGQKTGTNLDEKDNSLWGGLIVLGNAPVSVKSTDTEGNIEGIIAEGGLGLYGGTNSADNSGVLKYISVRHGGVSIGDDNEINGLTLGGVGTGTIVENIEVVANFDDGIECFGGTVNIKNALVAYQGDDALDIDQNYSGSIDNWCVIQGPGGDEALEIDGPEGSTYVDGQFTLINGSIKSDNGGGSIADLKSNAQGFITDISFEELAKGIKIADKWTKESPDGTGDTICIQGTDAYTNMLDGLLVISSSQLISSSASLTDFALPYLKDADENSICEGNLDFNTVENNVTANGNSITSNASVGADNSVFSWTWASANGKL